ncbi:hypothetical protein LJR098_002450 [Rhizobium sp. LjRoot98]|uniref:hypothetical protein n=1 Tax=unclassified Rhizobium TaxID=2613769 RepID=UPI0007156AC3|nr:MULTISPECIES: hypothetical protein [unclassified Rhizobium]KQV37593.1 hypothetical protein ASC96_26315 [Rhizobium sp. Root1204]KQY02598.1 hypothetical protein ASD36_15700 [Rhizobium sp. Root1334]KRB99213.1 hypothetical protein ASE23_13500 [Rhizobium sp. Root73]
MSTDCRLMAGCPGSGLENIAFDSAPEHEVSASAAAIRFPTTGDHNYLNGTAAPTAVRFEPFTAPRGRGKHT